MNLKSLLGNRRHKYLTAAACRPAKRPARLKVESLEERAVPATLPAPIVDQQSFRSITNEPTAFAPAMMADPTNPDQLFAAYVIPAGNGTRVAFRFSTNGGTTWSAPLNVVDELFGGTHPWMQTGADTKHQTLTPFEEVGDPTIAFDRFHNVFVTWHERHTDNTAGRIVLWKFTFNGVPAQTDNDTNPFNGLEAELYRWHDSPQAFNPNVAVDTNLALFQDPNVPGAPGRQNDNLAAAQTDKDLVRVFVTWNTNVVDGSNATPGGINPANIMMVYSPNGGATWTNSLRVNNDAFDGATAPYVFSKTVFTAGRAGETDSGARMVTVWSSNNGGPGNAPTVKSDAVSFAPGVPLLATVPGATGPIADAQDVTTPDIDNPVTTTFNIVVPAGTGLTRLDNIWLTLHINHQALGDLDIVLRSPNGQRFITLARNGTDEAGNNLHTATGQGLAGSTLGGGGSMDTTFQDSPFFRINLGTEPYRGDWRPEDPGKTMFSTFGGMTPAEFVGTWQLRITDHRASNTGSVTRVVMKLGQALPNGAGTDRGTGASAVQADLTGTNHPTKPAFLPAAGVSPHPSLVVDSTLGAFSPYQNRIYLAYTNGGSVFLKYVDGVDSQGGLLWNTAPINAGAGYMPELTIDPTTGTLVLAYYSARFDASGTRSTMMMQTAVNMADYKDRTGNIELSPAKYVTPEEQAFDQIRSKVVTIEPVPSNGPAIDATTFNRTWGNNLGLAAFNGRVNLIYTGNLNFSNAQIRTQDIQIAAGPRVAVGDMGPILDDAQVTPLTWNPNGTLPGFTEPGVPITFNTASGGDGRNRFTAFVVEFDRIINPASFGLNDIKVLFRGPNDDPIGPGTEITVQSITALDDFRDPLDDTAYGSKRFLVRVAPQTAVGTYSYLVGSDTDGVAAQITDRIRGPQVSFPSTGTQTFQYPGAPDQIVDFAGTEVPLTTSINVPAFPPGVVIGDVNVRVTITHSNVADLRLELIAPNGQLIILANEQDAFPGNNYQNTLFDDSSNLTLAGDLPPYTAVQGYRPATRLGQLFAANPAGQWQLRITDTVSGDTGVLNNWQLIISGVQQQLAIVDGNFIDQDGDGLENEVPTVDIDGVLHTPDGFAMPNPTSDTPFRLPYAVGSLPINITGPRLIGSRVSSPSQTASSDNLVLNAIANSIDVQFDRTIDATTFGPADILRIIGPIGDIPLSGVTVTPITALAGATTTGNSRFFRIGGLPDQKAGGTYTFQLSAQIADTEGNKLDTNANAGVGNLLGTVTNADVEVKDYGGNPINVAIPGNSITTVNLSVTEAYLLQRATATITIELAAGSHLRDLEGRLIAPDGTTVLLFVNAPQSGPDTPVPLPPPNQNILVAMSNTTFDDAGGTPVQLGGVPFASGTYNPIQPFAQLIGHGSAGTWKLQIKNKSATTTGKVTKFGIGLDKPVIGTGLGEEISDQTVTSFRIAVTDGTNIIARGNTNPVGAAPQFNRPNDNTAGRVGAVAVDPTDPSGNTVYAAGASGGVWRTTNFLTRDADGPTWVPLSDFGPDNAINVGSLAVYNTTGDPNKTTIVVGTGSNALNEIDKLPNGTPEGNPEFRFDGVGFLLSEDAGKSWQVLDSTTNYTGPAVGGSYLPFADPGRDHKFVGSVVNRIVFEPNVDAFTNRPIIWAAVGRGGAPAAQNVEGLWRSLDGGRTWTRIKAGEATDFLFGEGSELPNSGGRPTFAYLALQGDGVYFSSNMNSPVPSFLIMGGGVGRPTVNEGTLTVGNPETPNGANGRIALAVPALVPGDPLANNYYQRWLYAVVANTDGTFRGLYMTRDRGLNWTKLRVTLSGGFSDLGRDADITMFDPDTGAGWRGGMHSLTLAVDPNDPNIVYFGSDALIKVDTTLTNDPYAFSWYNHSNDAGGIRPNTVGATQVIDNTRAGGLVAFDFNFFPPLSSTTPNQGGFQGALTADPRRKWNHLNLDRDPYNPFRTDTSIVVTNTSGFTNNGFDTRWNVPGGFLGEGDFDFDWVSQIVTFKDPITGKGRIIFGHDEGIASYVAEGDGSLNDIRIFNQPGQGLGGSRPTLDVNEPPNFFVGANTNWQVNSKRNGNLQVARFYSGDSQPSLLAAGIAQSLFYGAARRINDAGASDEDALSTGSITWTFDGRGSRANFVAADQTGSGAVYILRRINDLPFTGELRTDFFQVSLNGNAPISRTNGLFQSSADAQGSGQWNNSVRRFAVNPIDPDGLVMSSRVGRIFRTVDQGLNWNPIAEPGTLDNSYGTAVAFGAPLPDTINLNDFIYVGTTNGNIFATTLGGGNEPNSWVRITPTPLDGSAVMKIVPSPTRGNRSLFAVTKDGIYFMADWNAPGAAWVNITGNIKTITANAFGKTDWNVPVLAARDPIMTIAVDWRTTYGPNPGKPILYVGGDGGIFRGVEDGVNTVWTRFPEATDGALSVGGGLPIVKVTDLDLSVGNVDPNTGENLPDGTADVLAVTTLGRGTFTLALGKPAGASGPKVIESQLFPLPSGIGPLPRMGSLRIKFNKQIDVVSFTLSDIVIKGPNGETLAPADLDEIVPPFPQPNQHKEWLITFPTLPSDGIYTVVVGPNITDGPNVVAGSGNKMNQNGNLTNGETPADQFAISFTVGENDLIDFVQDSYQKLLPNHVLTTADLTQKLVSDMQAARLKALSPVAKELLLRDDFRRVLVTRLYNNGGATDEIGHLLPSQVPAGAALDALVQALKDGKKTPQALMIDIIVSTAYFPQPVTDAEANAYMTKVYQDLFKGPATVPDSGIQFSWLPANVQTSQKNQVKTPTGRLNLIRSLVNGATVKYNQNGSPTGPLLSTNFRTHLVQLTYQKYLNRLALSTELSSGRTQLGTAPAAGQLQGLERLYQTVFSNVAFFSRFVQTGGPDAGLHTDRSWVLGVFSSRFMPTPAPTEVDTFSSHILNGFQLGATKYVGFKAQRQAFLKSLVNSTEYRTAEITKNFKLVHGPSRVVTQTEMNQWLNNLKAGGTYAGLVANRLGSTEFFNQAPGIVGGPPPTTTAEKNNVWARAVYKQLLNQTLTSTDPKVLALAQKAPVVGRASAALSLVVNGTEFRDKIITDSFQLILGRAATPTERTFYQDFLKKNNRWEQLLIDLMWAGPSGTLGREFWEITG